jgi:5-amino-6-(5-phosphoribosylamino)uracil reductase
MTARPYVLLSVAASLDGCIDDARAARLLLSNEADFDRVDEVRSGVDAILVGANTIRTDNPRLLIRSAVRRRRRVARGLPRHPLKVTLTGSGDVDPDAAFFTTGDSEKLVYTTTGALPEVSKRLGSVATVVAAGDQLDLPDLLADLASRGVRRLMVEGGSTVNTLFLAAGVVDELHVVIAPFFVGQPRAPRIVDPAAVLPYGPERRLTLAEVRPIGEVVLLRYLR